MPPLKVAVPYLGRPFEREAGAVGPRVMTHVPVELISTAAAFPKVAAGASFEESKVLPGTGEGQGIGRARSDIDPAVRAWVSSLMMTLLSDTEPAAK